MKTIPQIIIERLSQSKDEAISLHQSFNAMQIFKAAQEMGLETPDELAAIALDPRCSFKAKFAWALLHSLTFSRGTFVLGTLLFPIAVASSVYKAVSYFIRFFGS